MTCPPPDRGLPPHTYARLHFLSSSETQHCATTLSLSCTIGFSFSTGTSPVAPKCSVLSCILKNKTLWILLFPPVSAPFFCCFPQQSSSEEFSLLCSLVSVSCSLSTTCHNGPWHGHQSSPAKSVDQFSSLTQLLSTSWHRELLPPFFPWQPGDYLLQSFLFLFWLFPPPLHLPDPQPQYHLPTKFPNFSPQSIWPPLSGLQASLRSI